MGCELANEEARRPGWNNDVALKKRLAESLSDRLSKSDLRGGPDDIKAKWVTQNRAKIEQRRLELAKTPVTLR